MDLFGSEGERALNNGWELNGNRAYNMPAQAGALARLTIPIPCYPAKPPPRSSTTSVPAGFCSVKAALGMRNRLPGTLAALVTGSLPRGRAALQWDASLATTSTRVAPTYPERPRFVGKPG